MANPLNALIFPDTNILLDSYRIQRGPGGLELLEKVENHKNIIITGSQVEMEYKKNRQRVILDSLAAQRTPDWSGLTAPTFLANSKPYRAIATAKKTIIAEQKRARENLAKILANPSRNDPVYKHLQRIFDHKSPYNLRADDEQYETIWNLAHKRYLLGSPPRKNNDTSIGDAINWEWIVACAISSGRDIIIVTRDTDYGVQHNGEFFLNDWLRLEFRERVGRNCKIILTDLLSEALKLVAIPVSGEAEAEERVRAVISEVGAPENVPGGSDRVFGTFGSRERLRLNLSPGAKAALDSLADELNVKGSVTSRFRDLVGPISSPDVYAAMRRIAEGPKITPQMYEDMRRIAEGPKITPAMFAEMRRIAEGPKITPQMYEEMRRIAEGPKITPEMYEEMRRIAEGPKMTPEMYEEMRRITEGPKITPQMYEEMRRITEGPQATSALPDRESHSDTPSIETVDNDRAGADADSPTGEKHE